MENNVNYVERKKKKHWNEKSTLGKSSPKTYDKLYTFGGQGV